MKDSMCQRGCTVGAAFGKEQVHSVSVFPQRLLIYMLCQAVRWVLRALNLVKREIAGTESILYPEIRHG